MAKTNNYSAIKLKSRITIINFMPCIYPFFLMKKLTTYLIKSVYKIFFTLYLIDKDKIRIFQGRKIKAFDLKHVYSV